MPSPQFSLKTMLWLIALVAVFLAGAEWSRRRYEPTYINASMSGGALHRTIQLPDGSVWHQTMPLDDGD